MPVSEDERTIGVDGRQLHLTSLDRVVFPESGTTKRDIVNYYTRVSDVIVNYAGDRPATRKQWVDGVGTREHPGESFFHKNLDRSAPNWIARHTMQHKDHENTYPLLNDRATILWFVQMDTIEFHVPQWRFSRAGDRRNPDRLVLDLDPGDGAGLAECARVAVLARALLESEGLSAIPVTSGSKGIHLYAHLDGNRTSEEISDLAHELARALELDHPELVVSVAKKSLREGRVFVDWSQNAAAKTTVTPYSLRGRFTATVAAPRTWAELESPGLRQLDTLEVLARLEHTGDLFAQIGA